MAQSITGSVGTRNSYHGPFKSPGGLIYTVLTPTTSTISLMKSGSDPTSGAWAEQDSSNRPTAIATVNTISCFQKSSKIHVAFGFQAGGGGRGVYYARADMSSDAWDEITTGDRDISVDTGSADDGPAAHACSIAVEATGSDIIMLYQGATAKDMGTSFATIHYAKSTDGGVNWSVGNVVADISSGAGAVHFTSPRVVRGSSDRMHFFFVDHTNNDIYQRTLTSGDSLQSWPSAFDSTLGSTAVYRISRGYSGNVPSILYEDSDNTLSEASFTSSDTPTPSVTTGASNAAVDTNSSGDMVACCDLQIATAVYAVFSDATDQDGYWNSDNGSGWGASDTEWLDGATINHISARYYDRSGDKIGLIFDNAGTVFYDEIDLGGGGITLTAASGSFAWTGSTANLEHHRVIAAASGAWSWSGSAATLVHDFPIVAESGSFAWTGSTANLEYHRVITAASGSFTWSGSTANLEFHRVLAAAAGSFTWSGTDATLKKGITLTAESGAFAWTGTVTNLEYHRVLAAASGSFTWTGADATLSVQADKTLVAESGSFTWTGSSTNLEFHRVIAAASGGFTWTGTAANLEVHRVLAAASGAFAWSGSTANLEVHRVLAAASGSFAWTGSAATLSVISDIILTAESGSFVWSGTAANLEYNRVLAAASGAFSWTGDKALLVAPYTPQGIRFNSVHLTRGADLTGNADSKMLTWATWLSPATSHTGYIYRTTNGRFEIQLFSNGNITIIGRNSAGSIILNAGLTGSPIVTGTWQHLAVSLDLANSSRRHAYRNGVAATISWDAYTNDTIDFTENNHAIGGTTAGTSRYNGCLADFYLNFGTYIDLSDPDVLRELIRSTPLRSNDYGPNGQNPTGSSPIIFLSGPLASWATNDGTGGGFTINGSLAECATNPPSSAGAAVLQAASGSFTWSGSDANLEYNRILTAASGEFTWTGTDVNLERTRVLLAASGAFSWNGTAAELHKVLTLIAASGNFTWTGSAVGFNISPVLFAESGSFVVSGEATLTHVDVVFDWITSQPAPDGWAAENALADTWTPESSLPGGWSEESEP